MVHRTTVAILLALAAVTVVAAQAPAPAKPAEGAAIVNTNPQVTGTVISSETNRLVVKGDDGQQMVFIVNETTAEPRLFQAGDRVTANYVTLAGTGTVVSRVVLLPALVTTTTTTVTPPVAEAKVTATVAETYPAAPTAKASVTTTTTVAPVSVKTYAADDETQVAALPATASSLPLVALLGLLAAGGALAVHRFRHS